MITVKNDHSDEKETDIFKMYQSTQAMYQDFQNKAAGMGVNVPPQPMPGPASMPPVRPVYVEQSPYVQKDEDEERSVTMLILEQNLTLINIIINLSKLLAKNSCDGSAIDELFDNSEGVDIHGKHNK
jgi:hypothetical protein